MLIARLATASVLLALFISALFILPNTAWAVLLSLALLISSWEWAALAGLQHGARASYAAAVAVSALAVWLILGDAAPASGGLTLLETLVYGLSCVFWLFIAVPWLARHWRVRSPIALGTAGWIVLVPAWLALSRLQPEPERLLALLGIVWLADTAAYLSGRLWGRYPLAPIVSPGKTWEGVAGAAVAVAVYYVIVSNVVGEGSPWQGAGGAALFAGVALMSIVGDLFESWIKREAGVKDSGCLLPGHGGMLDRIDSMTSSLPAAVLLLHYSG